MGKTTKPNRFPGSVCSHVTLPRHSIRYLPPRPPRLCTFKSAPIPSLPRFSKLHNPNLAAQHTIRSTNCLAPHAVHELPRRPHRRRQGGILLPPGVKERRRPPREEAPRLRLPARPAGVRADVAGRAPGDPAPLHSHQGDAASGRHLPARVLPLDPPAGRGRRRVP
jgi:hypothetical protein